MQHPYPEIFIQFIVSICVGIFLITFIILIVSQYNKKKKAQQREMAIVKAAFEKELLTTQLEIQEDLLKNISMEIHDNIGQELLLTSVNLSILQNLEPVSQGAALITETKQIIGKIMEDISQLSRSMHSERITSLGVFRAIAHELNLLDRKKLFEVDIQIPEEISGAELSRETQLLLFRMYQEIIKNIIKHAQASKVSTSLVHTEHQLIFTMKDNGIGFDTSLFDADQQQNSHGVGMRSLRTRVALFGGKIELTSHARQGTSICIFIPRQNLNPEAA